MTAQEALVKIRVMLGMDEVKTETLETTETETNVELAEATLVDGTAVKTEGELEVGKTLMVITDEGEIVAPVGQHETTEGLLITVDEAGVITEIVEKEEEAPVETTEELNETSNEVKMSEEFLNKIIDVLKPTLEKLDKLEENFSTLNTEFHAFRDEPGSSKITNNLNELNKRSDDVLQTRFEKLVDIRKNYYNKEK